jgi:hypothetical protein
MKQKIVEAKTYVFNFWLNFDIRIDTCYQILYCPTHALITRCIFPASASVFESVQIRVVCTSCDLGRSSWNSRSPSAHHIKAATVLTYLLFCQLQDPQLTLVSLAELSAMAEGLCLPPQVVLH